MLNLRISIAFRRGTFFEGVRIKLQAIVFLIYHWALQNTQTDSAQVAGVERKTAMTFHQRLRKVAFDALKPANIKLGGPGKIVEIDESVEAKPKGMRSSASSSLIAATAASQIIPHHASVANVLNDQIPQTQKQKPKGKNELICEFCSRKCRSLVGLKAHMRAHNKIFL
jgi:hypothetical protein